MGFFLLGADHFFFFNYSQVVNKQKANGEIKAIPSRMAELNMYTVHLSLWYFQKSHYLIKYEDKRFSSISIAAFLDVSFAFLR